jgi:hypothetical protein
MCSNTLMVSVIVKGRTGNRLEELVLESLLMVSPLEFESLLVFGLQLADLVLAVLLFFALHPEHCGHVAFLLFGI